MRDPLDEELSRLPDEAAPPPSLEDRVVAGLRARGLLGGQQRPASRWAAAAAALLVAFAAGRLTAPVGPGGAHVPASGQYLLLLSTLPDESAGSELEARRVREYGAWARSLAREGKLVAGEKLTAHEIQLGDAPAGADGRPSGFFMVRARDLDEAVRIARSCPHLSHGGRLSVRPVDPT